MKDIPLNEKLAICKDDNGMMRVLYTETGAYSDRYVIATFYPQTMTMLLSVELPRKTINAILDLIHEHDHRAMY